MDRNFTSVNAFVYPGECERIEITSEECDRVFKPTPREGGISGKLFRIFSEINRECQTQDDKKGEHNYRMCRPTGIEAFRAKGVLLAMVFKRNPGGITWSDILEKKVCDAFTETGSTKQREGMIQVAAVAVQIIEHLNRRMENKTNEDNLR